MWPFYILSSAEEGTTSKHSRLGLIPGGFRKGYLIAHLAQHSRPAALLPCYRVKSFLKQHYYIFKWEWCKVWLMKPKSDEKIFAWFMSDSSHIWGVLIGVEYQNCSQTLKYLFTFCYLNAANSIKTDLHICNLGTGQFVSYKSVI